MWGSLPDTARRLQVSFAQVKVLTRILNMGDDCDRAFVRVATTGTVADTDKLYRHWKLNDDQHRPPPTSRWDTCGVTTLHRDEHLATVELRGLARQPGFEVYELENGCYQTNQNTGDCY